ncbi:hypothetical protein MUK42_10565 [Musa troglodytarum]|uniref:Uncharacterized protein n=1 Tax=Musa troglodytarum TaxID=320322 RepID=A0A9E7GN66_9LILI|nr:hypothetical protein MUK42_10565 [Musa troglodytarum]
MSNDRRGRNHTFNQPWSGKKSLRRQQTSIEVLGSGGGDGLLKILNTTEDVAPDRRHRTLSALIALLRSRGHCWSARSPPWFSLVSHDECCPDRNASPAYLSCGPAHKLRPNCASTRAMLWQVT